MFSDLLKGIELLYQILISDDQNFRNKRTLGRFLIEIHRDIDEIIIIGNEISSEATKNTLRMLSSKLNEISQKIRKSPYSDTIGVYFPEIHWIEKLLQKRAQRVELFLGKLSKNSGRKPLNYLWAKKLLWEQWDHTSAIVELYATDKELDEYMEILANLVKANERLRNFILNNFELAEVL